MESLGSSLEGAFRRTKELLFPFKSGVWFRLFFLFMLTGSCTGFPGGGGSGGSSRSNQDESSAFLPFQKAIQLVVDDKKDAIQNESAVEMENDVLGNEPILADPVKPSSELITRFRTLLFDGGGLKAGVVGIIAGLVLLGFIVILLLMYVSSRLRLALIRGLKTKEIRIRKQWNATRDLGNSYFKFTLAMGLIVMSFVMVVFGGFGTAFWPGAAESGGWGVFAVVMIGLVLLFIPVVVVLGVSFIFVPVIMNEKNRLAYDSFKSIFTWLKERPGGRIGLGIIYVLISMGVGIAAGLAMLIIGLVLLIPGGIIGGLLAVVMKDMGAIIVGILIFIGVILAAAVLFALGVAVTVPTQTFINYLQIELVEREMGSPASVSSQA